MRRPKISSVRPPNNFFHPVARTSERYRHDNVPVALQEDVSRGVVPALLRLVVALIR